MNNLSRIQVFVFMIAVLGHFSARASDSVDNIFNKFKANSAAAQDEKPTEVVPPSQVHKTKKSTKRMPASHRPVRLVPSDTAKTARPVVPSDAAPSEGKKDFGLSGDWGGFRSKLDNHGFDLAVIYKGEVNRVMSGGLERKTVFLQNLDVKAQFDGEKLVGRKGLSAFIYGIGDAGASTGNKPSSYVGDEQGTSNIETKTDAFKLYEAWLQQKFAEDKASVLFGLHDLNSEFYVTDTSSLFLNSSFGVGREFSQTGVMGPSIFPYTTAALRLRLDVSHFYVESGVFNAVAGNANDPSDTHFALASSDGYLVINEAAFVGDDANPYKYGLGYWTYTSTFDHSTETVTNSTGRTEPRQVTLSGVYVLFDQPLANWISTFARFGAASTQSNSVKNNLSFGLVLKGVLPPRADDKLGVAVTRVAPVNGDDPSETAYELTYRAEVGQGVAIQPDVQLVDHPGFSNDTPTALVGALRFELGF